MKKNILLVLLSAALLTGCELDLGFIKFANDGSKESEQQQKQEENNQNSQENQGENENKPEGSGEQQGQPGDVYTALINTSGAAISAVATKSGVSIDTTLLSGAEKAELFKTALKNQLQYDACLTSITCVNLYTAVWQDVCMIQIGSGNPAKGNLKSGTFTWNSSAKIYKVEIDAQCYSKEQGATDSLAHLKVDESDYSLEVAENEELEFKTISKEYAEGTNSFSLVNDGGRVLLKSLKITWRF